MLDIQNENENHKKISKMLNSAIKSRVELCSKSIHQVGPKWSIRDVLSKENSFIWVSAKFGGVPLPK